MLATRYTHAESWESSETRPLPIYEEAASEPEGECSGLATKLKERNIGSFVEWQDPHLKAKSCLAKELVFKNSATKGS